MSFVTYQVSCCIHKKKQKNTRDTLNEDVINRNVVFVSLAVEKKSFFFHFSLKNIKNSNSLKSIYLHRNFFLIIKLIKKNKMKIFSHDDKLNDGARKRNFLNS